MEQKLRILHIMAGGAVGGAENIFLENVVALAECPELEQMVVTRPVPFRLQQLAQNGVPTLTASFNPWWPFGTRAAIKQAIKQHKPHIVQYWMGRAGQFAVSGAHINVAWYGGYYNRAKRFATCQHHVVMTRDLERHVVASGAKPQDVSVLHSFASFPDNITPQDRAELDTPQDATLLLGLARLHVKKGFDVLLEALVQLPNCYAWIAGDGPLRDVLHKQAETLGVANRVRWLGWRNDRERLLKAADICVFPSRYEPFGTVMVDAWAMNVPLVAAASQGPKAYVRNADNGLLIPTNDVPALVQAVQQLQADKNLCAKIVAGGAADYAAHFSKAAFQKNAVALYQHILSQHHAAAAA